MPTYVYRRPDGTTFESFQKISDAALATDPETGVPVQRVISGGAGLQFKGSGFYLTDYGRGGQTKPPKEPTSDSSSDSSGKSEPKADSKAESKAEAKAAPAKESAPAAKPDKS